MRIMMILIILGCLLFGGYTILQYIKYDTTISITVIKGPFKGVSFKLMDYKVSLRDLHSQHEFWDSELGKSVFKELSTTLQTIVKAGAQYLHVEIDVNYLGLFKKHYSIQNLNDILT